ncbi:hypothetical protein [Sulfurivermis fontis]|uniref:hypothetical protein n=1 Tax=Sulfurivermis fontis TaxID=1972068 RepID=UPI003B831E9F
MTVCVCSGEDVGLVSRELQSKRAWNRATLGHRAATDTPTPIQLALARGHRWLAMVDKFAGSEFGRRSRPRRGEPQGRGEQSGVARTLSEVAEREGMDRAYVSRMVNLTTLAPDIVAAILDETLPPEVTLFDLASGTPLLWEEQRARLWNTRKAD